MAIDKKHIKNISGKDFVLYAGLLEEAHRIGLKEIRTELLQIPAVENSFLAIVKATCSDGENVFEGIGDASPKNVNKMIASHILRMAETRAKARALRDMTNIGITAFEELGDIEEIENRAPSNKQLDYLRSLLVTSNPNYPVFQKQSFPPAPEMTTEQVSRAISILKGEKQ